MRLRMVDRIVGFTPRRSICGTKTISFEEYELKSVFAGQPCLPESLVMESLFQLGNWLIILTSGFSQMGLVIRVNEVQFQRSPGPGQTMSMEVNVRRYRDDGVLFDGRALVDRQVIASGNGCVASPVDLAQYHDPEDLKVLFSEIYRPESGNER